VKGRPDPASFSASLNERPRRECEMGLSSAESTGVNVLARANGQAPRVEIVSGLSKRERDSLHSRTNQVATTPAAFLLSRVVLRPRRISANRDQCCHLGGSAGLTGLASKSTPAVEPLRSHSVTALVPSSRTAIPRLADPV
jgi:hypothetical protein